MEQQQSCAVTAPALAATCPATCSSPAGISGHLFLLLINAVVSAKCRFLAAQDFPPDVSGALTDGATFDFIVAGGGSAGAVVAARLAEANDAWKVLLVEAGPLPMWDNEVPALFYGLQGGPLDWAYVTEPETTSSQGFKHRISKWPRGKVLGGSSQLNAMLYVRGHPKDYDEWAELGNKGWAYADVLPYFLKAQRFVGENDGQDGQVHGSDGPLMVTRLMPEDNAMLTALRGASLELEKKDLGLDADGYGLYVCPTTIADGRRASTARCYLTRDVAKSRLQMALQTEVVRVNQHKGRATGVTVRMSDGRTVTLNARKEVVLSAGAINSPALLMRSGIKLPGIGQNMQDHITTFYLLLEADQPAPGANAPSMVDFMYEYMTYFTGPLSRVGISNVMWFTHSNRSIRRDARMRAAHKPNVQIHLLDFQRGQVAGIQLVANAMGVSDASVRSLGELLGRKRLLTMAVTLLYPRSVGHVRVDAEDKVRIVANYLSDEGGEDMKVMADGVEYVAEMLDTDAMRKVNATFAHFASDCDGERFASRAYFECNIRHFAATIYHPIGTCKMGQDPSAAGGAAVVDEKLRVWGVQGLRVIDASIMPVIVGGNTNAPSIMIGEKGADMIIAAHSK